MEIKTIIRVAHNIELTDALRGKLKQRYGNNIEVVQYPKNIDQLKSYQQRMDSLHQAMLFVLETIPLPENNQELKEAIRKHLDYCLTQKNDLDSKLHAGQYQDVLFKYKNALLSTLQEYWKLSDAGSGLKHETEILNKAEQYVIMSNGRDDLVTLSLLESYSHEHYVVQTDRQLHPCTQETLDELLRIKNSDISLTPTWFKELPTSYPAQVFLHNLDASESKSFATIKSALITWSRKWELINKNTSAGLLQQNLEVIKNNDTSQFPDWFKQWTPAEQAGLKDILRRGNNITKAISDFPQLIDQWTKEKDNNTINNLQDPQKLPFWYLKLAEHEQLMLKAVLRKHPTVEDAVSSIPSRLREIPGLPNFGRHTLEVVDKELQAVEAYPPLYRSSHPVPRDELGKSGNIATMQAVRNLQRVLSFAAGKKMVSIQTLISPVKILSPALPDYALNQLRKETLRNEASKWVNIKIHSGNHPLNYAKYVQYTSANDGPCNSFLTDAKEHLKPASMEAQIASIDTKRPEVLLELAQSTLSYLGQFKDWQAHAKLESLTRKIIPVLKNHTADQIEVFVTDAIKATERDSIFAEREKSNVQSEQQEAKNLLTQYLVYNIYDKVPINERWENKKLSNFLTLHFSVANTQSLEEKNFIKTIADIHYSTLSYDKTLHSGIGTASFNDYDGRELCLASLKNVITQLMDGLSYGSCVSGKDRKAIEILLTDAIHLFRSRYGFYPQFNVGDSYRANFVDIVAELYATGHQHAHAGQNAPGSDGIKTPYVYLPADIVKKIVVLLGKDALYRDDERATNNELKYIKAGTSEGKAQRNEEPACAIAAARLSPANQQSFINELTLLLNKSGLWYPRINVAGFKFTDRQTGRTPTGISSLGTLLVTNKNGVKNTIAEVYKIVEERLATPCAREANVTTLYDRIHDLYEHKEPDTIFNNTVAQLRAIGSGKLVHSTLSESEAMVRTTMGME